MWPRASAVRLGARIQGHRAVAVPADEVCPPHHVLDVCPAVRMDRSTLARRDHRLQHTHALILEQQVMVIRRCEERIQLVWPLPLRHRRSDNRGSPGLLAPEGRMEIRPGPSSPSGNCWAPPSTPPPSGGGGVATGIIEWWRNFRRHFGNCWTSRSRSTRCTTSRRGSSRPSPLTAPASAKRAESLISCTKHSLGSTGSRSSSSRPRPGGTHTGAYFRQRSQSSESQGRSVRSAA